MIRKDSSSLLLDERSVFNMWALSALALICVGIIVVFTGKEDSGAVTASDRRKKNTIRE